MDAQLTVVEKELLEYVLPLIENDRQEGIKEAVENMGDTEEQLRDRFLSEGGKYELMDRAFIAHEHVESYLVNHPFALLNPQIYRLASIANHVLAELYQAIGRMYVDGEDDGVFHENDGIQVLVDGEGNDDEPKIE